MEDGGGRYDWYQSYAETHRIWTDSLDNRDTILVDGKPHTSSQATIWRWRKHFQHDFAARMDWCVADAAEKANHNPIAILNGDTTKRVVELNAKPGETVKFASVGTRDPDGNTISRSWMIYREASSMGDDVKLTQALGGSTAITIPKTGRSARAGSKIHVILTVEDDGTPSMVAYRRAVVTVVE